MRSTIRIAALALVLAALAVVPAGTELRAQTPDSASLTALTVTPGSLDPAFSSTVTSYTVALAHDVDQITIVATPAGAGSVAFARAGFFGPTPLPDADPITDGHQVDITGANILVEVTETGLTKATYTLAVNRALPPPAALTALTVTPGTLDPAFSSTITSYTVALAHDVDQITIVATPAGAGSVEYKKPGTGLFGVSTPIPDADTSTDGHQVDVAAPFLGFINVEVTETGLTKTTYRLRLDRAPPPAASLTALAVTPGSLDPAFSSTVISYTVALAHDVDQITIVGTPADAGTVEYKKPGTGGPFGTGPTVIPDADTNTDGHQVDVLGTSTVILVVVTEAGHSEASYTVTVDRAEPPLVARDRAALMALFNSTGGASWTMNDNWGSTEPLGEWENVSTDSDGRVIHLGLEENSLVGTLPDELGNLTSLEKLYLGVNALSGSIPASLGSLTNLQVLSLYNNQLSGTIPNLGNLASLTLLSLYNNELRGQIPDSLGNLTSLTLLSLYDNELTGQIPDSLSNLDSLTHLYLSSNALSGTIPDSLGNLANLQSLYLSSNALSGTIQDSLGNLANLQSLHLWDNDLSGTIPDSLGNLANLQSLHLSDNDLSGGLPTSLGNLTRLHTLNISNNNFDGPIPDLSRLSNLQWVYLWDNQLSGEFPATLASRSSLKELWLNRNALSGTIPDLGALTNLTHLYLNHNQLSGAIPSLSSLTSLVELSLSSNQLSGAIPSLSSLGSLKYLYLDHNALSGTIPNLSSLTNLTRLYLDHNQLSGAIPAWLGDLTTLTDLSLDTNELDGTIPDLSRLVNLIFLSLRNNALTGEIPAWLGQLTRLQRLYLSANQLSGDFPAALGSLTELNVARFASNTDADDNPSLTGCVPLGLRYLLTAPDYESYEYDPDRRLVNLPAQDFIAVDANGDGDTDDDGDTPGLNLPFCMVSALAFSDVSLEPAFASGTAAYTASVANTVDSTTVTATLDANAESSDRVSIRKGTASYTSGAAVPLAVGPNEITITVTPTDGTPTLTYTVTVLREGVDRATLMALYNSTSGASWTNKDNWGSNEPLNDWFGVTADGSENVTDLDLSSNNLRGTLPADLGTLSNLTTLDLSDNRLSGTIPDLSVLTGLMTLNLRDNQLSGTIPDWLSGLTSLTTLNLGENRLTGAIPEELGYIFLLDVLYLDNNQLSGPIPVWLIGEASGLQVTRFAGNTLTGCVPNLLRYLVTAQPFESLPAHDFIAVDANDDGDTDDDGDTPGLGLPFCTLRSLTLSGVTLKPVFASDTVIYTAAADHAVTSPTVTATAYNSSDTVAITKGADSYTSGGSVPLAVGPNVITIEITPDDGTPTHTYTVTVTRARNTPPAFDEGATTTRGADENTPAGMDIGAAVAATDADFDALTYSLDTTSAASFDIISTTGQLQTKAALDHETRSSYTVTVSVRDSKDANGDADEVTDDTISVTILVADMNEAPEFPIGETDTRSVDENTIAGENIGAPVAADDDDNDTLTYSLDLSSRATFDIVATTGQLQTRAALDYEGTSSYTVNVTATDPLGADDTIIVTITVDNVDEAGRVTLSTTRPIDGRPVTAMLHDPDDVLGNVTWSWRRASSRTALGTIISGATSDSYTPVTAGVGYFLRTTASYTDGEGSDKSASLVSTNRVQPAPVGPNEDPEFPPTETGARSVDENTPPGVNIGEPVAATDPDDDPLTYSLDPAGALSFDIVVTTGQLQTKAALDYETTAIFATYFVTVTATDTAGATVTITVYITVNNLDEPGTVTLSSLQPLVAIPLTATLDDPDDVSGSATWSWARSPSGAADWTPISGETSDTYTPVAGDVGDYLRALVSYTDEAGPDKSALAISASAVEAAPGRNNPVLREHPTATRSVTRNTPAGRNIGAPFTATDADNDVLTYTLGGPDGPEFDIDASSGQLLTKAVLTGISRATYKVFVSVSDGKDDQGNPETTPQVDTTTGVTISVTTPRRSGGGGGGFGGPVLLVTTVVVGEAPADLSFVFAYTCANALGEPVRSDTFTVAAGRPYGVIVAAGLSCTLTVTDDGGATAVDGLLTDVVIPPGGLQDDRHLHLRDRGDARGAGCGDRHRGGGRVTHDPRAVPRLRVLGAPGDR